MARSRRGEPAQKPRAESKPYKRGPRKQMTPAWKKLVLDMLADNAKHAKEPGTLGRMAAMIPGADKAGIIRTFRPSQVASVYVDDICALLGIDPPLVESAPIVDAELQRDLDFVSGLPADARRKFVDGLKALMPNTGKG